jgi:hypothetical protein
MRNGKKRVTAAERLRQAEAGRDGGVRLRTGGVFGDGAAHSAGVSGFEDDTTRKLLLANHYLRRAGVTTLKPVLPAMLALKGRPYTLTNHFPFEPFFRTRMPKTTLLKTGRQVSKSTSLAAQGIIFSNSIPYFSTLYVTPLYEMIRRFSHNYVRNFLENSPVKRLFLGNKNVSNVLQREFMNGSTMYFSFAFMDAERTRGIPADKNVIDEVQDMNYDFLSIIHETLSGSEDWGIKQYAGTPKSLDNTMQKLWADSSQAEWVIRCRTGGCNHWNVPSFTHDLEGMIGPWHRDVSEKCPGVVCAKCRKPLDPRRHGRWVHAYKERRWTFAGYHVPQMIMPMHYADEEKWSVLVGKYNGKNNTPTNVFFNEVCGESFDLGAKLVTETDLRVAACLSWRNDVLEAERQLDKYVFRILAVDWGGGGGRLNNSNAKRTSEQRERTSFTTLAVLGMRPDGKIDVIWGHRSMRTHDHVYEARLVLAALARFQCSHLVHDYNGAGSAREQMIAQSGFPLDNIVAIAYHPSARKNLMNFHPATDDHPRNWYSVDKSRSLYTTCQMIKLGLLRFFQWDWISADDPGLISDFLGLLEEKVAMRLGTDLAVITKNPTATDDFAQATNVGAMAICYISGKWPDLAGAARLIIPADLLRYCQPTSHQDWQDLFL